jgi:hypothetical protein
MEKINPWSQVVSLLSHISSGDDAVAGELCRAACRRGARAARIGNLDKPHLTTSFSAPRCKITAIERQDDASALISWCDPTMGHYVDQVWGRVAAPKSGYCALTGQRIQRGDVVFKPRVRGRHHPVNYEEMILGAALAQAD